MAEWLRRLTRNQMGSSRVGSNPTRSEENSFPLYFFFVSVRIRHLIMADFSAAMAEWLNVFFLAARYETFLVNLVL